MSIFKSHRRTILIILGVSLLGNALDYFPISIFPGIHFILGPAVTIALAVRFGPAAGGAAGFLGALRTWWLWRQPFPFSALLYGGESAAVGWLRRRFPRLPLVALTSMYWVLLGSWINLAAQVWIFHLPANVAVVIQIRSIANGILCGMLAELIVLAMRFWKRRTSVSVPEAPYSMGRLISVLLTLCVAAPIFATSISNARQLRQDYIETADRNASQNLESAITETESVLRLYTRALRVTANLLSAEPVKDQARLNSLLHTVRLEYPALAGLYVADSGGRTIGFDPLYNDRGEYLVGLDFSDRDYYRELVATRKIVYSGVFRARGALFDPTVTIGVPINGPSGEFLGYVMGGFSLGAFGDIASRGSSEQDERLIITDRSGLLIADSQAPHSSSVEVLDYSSFQPFKLASSSDRGSAQYTDNGAGQSGVVARTYQNTYSLTYGTVATPGWRMMVVRSHKLAESRIAALYLRALIVIALATIVTAILSHFVARALMRPLVSLEDSVSKLARGDLSARPSRAAFASSEVASLEESFQKMAAAIEESWTSLRLSKQEAERQEQFLSRLIQSAREAIFTLDVSGRITWNNGYLANTLSASSGADAFAPAGTRFLSFVHREDAARVEGLFARALAGEVVSYETRIVLPSSHDERLIAVVHSPFEEEGRVTGVLGIARDITEESKLRHKLQQAEKLSAIGQLVSGVAHELNNPLTGVLGFSQLALMDESLPREVRDSLKKIEGEALRARKIVQNLLTFARQAAAECEQADVNDIVRSTIELRLYHLRVSGIEVIEKLAGNLPPIFANFQQLQQVVLNLIVNAEQAMIESHGGGTLSIETRLAAGGIEIRVSDNGPGVPAHLASRVFEPFFTTKDVGEGTGLGLSICYGIMQEHGGSIVLDQNSDKGATFVLQLPVSEGELCKSDFPSEASPSTARAGRRILIVDDEPVILSLAQRILERKGCQVATAESGARALDLLLEQHFDLVITDVRMPGMSGPVLYQEIVKAHPQMRDHIVFSTGDSACPETAEFLASVGALSLHKPFTASELAGLIDQVC